MRAERGSGNKVSVSRATRTDADTRVVVVVVDLSDGDFSGWRCPFTPHLNWLYYYSGSHMMRSCLGLDPDEIRLPVRVSCLCLHSGHALHTGDKECGRVRRYFCDTSPTWEAGDSPNGGGPALSSGRWPRWWGTCRFEEIPICVQVRQDRTIGKSCPSSSSWDDHQKMGSST